MKRNVQNNAGFWLKLLEEGDSDAEKKGNWNKCLCSNIRPIKSFFPNNFPKNIVETIKFDPARIEYEEREKWKAYAAGRLEIPSNFTYPIESFMDFSNVEFPENISFAGRLLIGADFRNAVFNGWADFRGAAFLGLTHFEGARFEGHKTMQPASHGVVSFADSIFCNTVYFKGTEFPRISRFDNSEFLSAGYFQEAIFGNDSELSGVLFDCAKFGAEPNFSKAMFFCAGGFKNVEFNDGANFRKTKFFSDVNFNNSKFNNTTSFREATFGQPPKFFEAVVHEDINFNGIDWNKAELSYSNRKNKDVKPDEITTRAENAVLAWERLALIMSKQEKPWERHEFFRLKMRAKRQAEGISISSTVNWLFDILSDYGWGIRRSLTWWFGHIILFWLVLAGAACYQANENGDQLNWWIPLDGFLVSLSNSLSFLRLQSGYLSSNYKDLEKVLDQVMWLFSTVGTIQAMVGPILLFLLLLTLRNRFRMG
ncbi:MAG: hypothetical protein OXC57_12055 [Rhodobacteraceae bacterium]|nr:hypothetical protein [Paracoccaceae bacterium]